MRLRGPRPLLGMRPQFDPRGPRPRLEGPLRPFDIPDKAPMDKPDMPPKIVPGSPMDDPRWSSMAGLLAKEIKEEVVIDGKPYEVQMNNRHILKICGQNSEVFIDPIERGVRINGNIVYKFGEPKKSVDLGYCKVEIFFHGSPLNIWIDGQQHRVRLDAPPLNMTFDNQLFGFQIDGRDNMILVDRLEKGPLGGPPRTLLLNGTAHEIAFEAPKRHILIDSQHCELKLDRKIPFVIYNGKPHGIRFEGPPRKMFIDEVAYMVPLDTAVKAKIGLRPHILAFGGPAHEVIIDGKWYEIKFNNVPKNITIGNKIHSIRLEPPVPRVKILAEITQGLDEGGDSMLGQRVRPMPQPPLPPAVLKGPDKVNNQPMPNQPMPNQPGIPPRPMPPGPLPPNQQVNPPMMPGQPPVTGPQPGVMPTPGMPNPQMAGMMRPQIPAMPTPPGAPCGIQ